MERYISLLRGINVSGKNVIKMASLRTSFERIGFHDVTTYVQSGNIIFSVKKSSIKKLEQIISQQIKNEFGLEIPTIVLTTKTLEEVIAGNPFVKDTKKNPAFFHITFLKTTPENVDMNEIEAKKMEGEEIMFVTHAFYLYCPLGYGNTKLNNNFLEKKLKIIATTRNWKTTNELLRIAGAAMEKK